MHKTHSIYICIYLLTADTWSILHIHGAVTIDLLINYTDDKYCKVFEWLVHLVLIELIMHGNRVLSVYIHFLYFNSRECAVITLKVEFRKTLYDFFLNYYFVSIA